MTTLQAALSGALVGGMFAVMAAGLSLTWGMLRVINLAHFGLILVGAYLTFQLATSWGIDPILTIVLTVPLMFLVGAGLQWAFDRLGVEEFASLLVSFGLLIIVMQTVSNVWSADFQRMDGDINPYATESVSIGRFVFPAPTLIAFVFAVVIVVAADQVLRRTFAGRALRAFAEDRAVASAFGIDHRRLGMVLAGLSAASAAVAGMLFALGNAVTPSTPFEWIGVVFAVVILGGIGQVGGVLLAGVLVGTLSAVVSATWSPALSPLVLFSAIILALLFRPYGLLTPAARGAR
ncbi:branched-chain amino acid ABC transporter permease [Jiangella mangrovi]|uniref:Branched-chain amino acid transport system permease protein n=1 Tax=Jiangella mangrovi TaxID=1524084 RepID=A0A7W9GVF9_9ACTN|nr:branched-chain amino acid ABC transporter permease [Jiangella mangrovi]MBB5790471.1 branched-chain amino acid transport system permease protein [Jiangella mangrovi]